MKDPLSKATLKEQVMSRRFKMRDIKQDGGKLYIRKAHKGEIAIDFPVNQSAEIITWCHDVFGTPGNGKQYKWRTNYVRPRIFLKSNDQLLMFTLKWL